MSLGPDPSVSPSVDLPRAGTSPDSRAVETSPAAPAVGSLLDLSGRVAIVTGADRGIGAGIARRLAEAGADVAIVHRSAATADPAAAVAGAVEGFGRRAMIVEADLTSEPAVEAMVEAVEDALGRIDIIVNNAGLQPLDDLLETTAERWDEVQATNARGVFLATRAVALRMITQGRGGAIVNVASIEGLQPTFRHGHYAASKAAVLMHTRSAALELGPHGIRVNAVAPGLIDTGSLEADWPEGVARWQAAVPLGRLGTPADVADACLFLCSAAARWISGATLVVDGGVLTHPTW